MQVSLIKNNYYNSNRKVSAPNFKAILSPSETKRVLRMLKPAITETILGRDIDTIKMTFHRLARKYSPRGINSYGIMVIPDKNLREFCGNKIPIDKLDSMKGYCVSAGGKYSPMQIWTEVYETNVVVIPKNKILDVRV